MVDQDFLCLDMIMEYGSWVSPFGWELRFGARVKGLCG